MIDFDKLKIPGCEKAVEKMKAISDEIASLNGRSVEIKQKIAEKQKLVKQAREERLAADKDGSRQGWEKAFDKEGTLVDEIKSLEKELSAVKPQDFLRERYEQLRRKVYSLEKEANDGVKQAQVVVEQRKPLRGYLQTLLAEINKL